MAGNRLHRTGSIFERLTGILKTGAMKEQDKPLWYDVYKAFPPKYEPKFARPAVDKEIKPIFYPEDIIRGKFIKTYGNVSVHNLLREGSKSIIQRFVELYQEIEKSGNYKDEEAIFKAVENAFDKEGITFLRNKRVSTSKKRRLGCLKIKGKFVYKDCKKSGAVVFVVVMQNVQNKFK